MDGGSILDKRRGWWWFLSLGPSVRDLANAALLGLTIASQLRALRRKHKLTRRQAASRAGIHWLTLARYEWALAAISIRVLLRLASAYDVALVGRFCSWGEWVQTAEAQQYSPRDVLKWRRSAHKVRQVDAPLSFDEEHAMFETGKQQLPDPPETP
jgi:transcriptional regulator with XRE-family HTH domain